MLVTGRKGLFGEIFNFCRLQNGLQSVPAKANLTYSCSRRKKVLSLRCSGSATVPRWFYEVRREAQVLFACHNGLQLSLERYFAPAIFTQSKHTWPSEPTGPVSAWDAQKRSGARRVTQGITAYDIANVRSRSPKRFATMPRKTERERKKEKKKKRELFPVPCHTLEMKSAGTHRRIAFPRVRASRWWKEKIARIRGYIREIYKLHRFHVLYWIMWKINLPSQICSEWQRNISSHWRVPYRWSILKIDLNGIDRTLPAKNCNVAIVRSVRKVKSKD